MATCLVPAEGRRRLFWATQPGSCGDNTVCGFECGIPGLEVAGSFLYDCAPNCSCCAPATVDPACADNIIQRNSTILTTNWLRGLIINMLMTDGRQPDTACGYKPGSQGGHWSESYIESGPTSIGTLMRGIETTGRIQNQVALITAYAEATLERLIERGVALSVDVVGTYLGNGKMQLDIEVAGRRDGVAKVGISGARVVEGWVWE